MSYPPVYAHLVVTIVLGEDDELVQGGGGEHSRFVDELPAVLADAPPLPGEEARYAQVLAMCSTRRRRTPQSTRP